MSTPLLRRATHGRGYDTTVRKRWLQRLRAAFHYPTLTLSRYDVTAVTTIDAMAIMRDELDMLEFYWPDCKDPFRDAARQTKFLVALRSKEFSDAVRAAAPVLQEHCTVPEGTTVDDSAQEEGPGGGSSPSHRPLVGSTASGTSSTELPIRFSSPACPQLSEEVVQKSVALASCDRLCAIPHVIERPILEGWKRLGDHGTYDIVRPKATEVRTFILHIVTFRTTIAEPI